MYTPLEHCWWQVLCFMVYLLIAILHVEFKERGSTIYKVFMFYTLIFLNTCWGPGFMIYVLQFWWYLLVDFDLQKSTISWHVGGLCFIFTRLFEQDTVRIYVLYFIYKIFVRWLTALCKLHGLCFEWRYELWLQG